MSSLFAFAAAILILTHCTAAQQFFDGSGGVDVTTEGITAACSSALNETLQCNGLLGVTAFEGSDLSATNITDLCQPDCEKSLKDLRSAIQDACPTEDNRLTLGTTIYPATATIDFFLSTWDRLCLKKSTSNEFCYNEMRPWQQQNNLTHEQLCSDCFLDTLRIDLSSEYTHNDDVAETFSSLTSSCQKTGFGYTSPTHIALSSSVILETPNPQTCDDPVKIAAQDTCNSISLAHNVSTSALLIKNRLPAYCRDFPRPGTSLCLPPSCDVHTVRRNDTCEDVVRQYSYSFTTTQLLSWNANLNALCTIMAQQQGMQICVSPPGVSLHHFTKSTQTSGCTTTTGPPPTNTASFAEPSRSTTTAQTTKEGSVPIAPGTLDGGDCQSYPIWTDIAQDDQYANSCEYITTFLGSSLQEFLQWNPSLKGITPCELQKGYRYCIISWDFANESGNAESGNVASEMPSTGDSPHQTSSLVRAQDKPSCRTSRHSRQWQSALVYVTLT
ncbi:hypothetical protein M409DRAFT_57384 [Zasmidium cellare ATCC 36951]|uniref:LysM domain-containing protein n=1 Tax=Zasmidium cellare ATCC 36951 TaxID=1080233 RepID=A0A6A6C9I7_ZASCE|nr:uncharacterized protein M409DRAFT_57384 [Zasmidium cellare ATCC 36951]KAF2163483.1 hypothetical protein M409DRAFT_57384 [Zasmidium cellare ATCC 36951]